MANTWYLNYKSAQSDGTLPIKSRATQMRYKKTLSWSVTVGGDIAGGTRSGRWTVEIFSPSGSLLFRQTVTLRLYVLVVGILMTWNRVDDIFDTTNVGGVVTTKENIGLFLLGGTAVSEQGDNDPPQGAGSFIGDVKITTDWISPIYVFGQHGAKTLPKGSYVKVSRDQWDLGPASVEYQWAFLEGAELLPVDSTFAPAGDLLVVRPLVSTQRVAFDRAWPTGDYRFREFGGRIKGQYAKIHHLKTGHILLVVQDDEGTKEYVTVGGCDRFERVKYPDIESGMPKEALLFGPNSIMQDSLLIGDDNRIILELDGDTMYTRAVTREEGIGPRTIVGEVPEDVTPTLEAAPDGRVFIIGGKGIPIYQSRRFPPLWTPVNQGVLL